MSSSKQHKKRLPVIPVLFFVLVFGGLVYYGYTHFFHEQVKTAPTNDGLNNRLPSQDTVKVLNKLELYMQAEKDSAVKKEQRENDPYSKATVKRSDTNTVATNRVHSSGLRINRMPHNQKIAQQEEAVDRKMKRLYQTINENRSSEKPVSVIDTENTIVIKTKPKPETDPELQQLEGMLDKLMLIQHPELVKQRKAIRDSSIVVTSAKAAILGSVTAVVHNTQVLATGSTIKFRLTEDMKLKERVIPKGAFLFGVCGISNERLMVQVNHLAYLNEVIPVSLNVFDIDGIEGIYVPGTVSREVIKDGTNQAIQSFNPGSYDPSLTGQVASAGLQATKALLSRKVKMVRVTVKAGHRILLQNSNYN